MTSEKQVRANQQNAQNSTGPKSAEGKRKVSSNRLTHGILSGKLLLPGEPPDDYQSLLDDLQAQLRPVGVLELSLVEKIAVGLWRQRRLVSAETAIIELGVNPNRIADEVTSGLGLSGYGGDKVEPEDLKPLDQGQLDQLDWCRSVIAQYNAGDALSPDNLSTTAPLIYKQLAEDAEADEESIQEYLAHSSFEAYIGDLIRWCQRETAKLENKIARQPVVAALSEKAKDKLTIPWLKLDILTKYQNTLDNQLYKATKALRDEQTWRIDSLDALEPVSAVDPADAA
jgi:hypothetical protein